MTDKNLRNLIDQLQYKSRPDVKERMREKIDRAWNQQNFGQDSKEGLPIWRILMNSPKTKFAVAAVLIIAVVLGAIPFLKHTTPPTFAQVISPLMHAETAMLTIVIGQPGQPNSAEIQDMILGNRIRRTVPGAQENTSIIDLETSQVMVLDPSNKVAVYVKLENLPEIPNYMERLRNVITVLEEAEGVQMEYLPEHDLDGRTVLGYHATYPGGQLYIWADPVTYAPVQIDQYEGQMTIICKDLQFDVPMDAADFSMDVPEGYTTQQTQLDLASGTEEAFIEGLRLWAEYVGDGFFPEDVRVEAFIRNAPMMGQKLEALGLSDAEAMEIGMALGRHVLFIRFFKGQGQWYYNGKDVMVGDENVPVFWYQPAGSQTWRVIYGDLRVEDVTEENLPTVMPDEARAANKAKYEAAAETP